MSKVLILQGLPASGKSTFAKELVQKDGTWKRINKDDLRNMIHGGKFTSTKEKQIISVRNLLILHFLEQGFNVVVDDTNLNPRHITDITALVKGKADIETKFFDISIEDAIKRDLSRSKSVGESVIKDMYRKYILPKKFPPIVQDKSWKPRAVIFDIDGTLAKMNGRSPYDMSRVGEDTPNESICRLADDLNFTGVSIICFSGRDDSCREATEKWLIANGVSYIELFMRKHGDNRSDDIIKYELLQKVVSNYYIDYVVDDRGKVVDMWRACGLTCLQVDYGNF